MHILVATRETQGAMPDDFFWAVDGELVRLPFDECARPGCGCSWSFSGLASSRATTTALVVDSPLTVEEYRIGVRDGLVRQRFLDPGVPEAELFAREEADELLALVAVLAPGTVVGYRDGSVNVRAVQSLGP